MATVESAAADVTRRKLHLSSTVRQNYIVSVLTLAYVLSLMDRMIIGVLVEPIKRDLGLSDTSLAVLHGIAFALFYAILGLPIGWLVDRFRRVPLAAAGIFLWSLMTMLCGLARSYTVLFIGRVGVGVGEASLTPAAYSIFADVLPRERLSTAIGVYAAGGTLGAGFALLAGGAIYSALSAAGQLSLPFVGSIEAWQATFIAVGLPGIIMAALVWFSIPEPPRRGAVGQEQRGSVAAAVESLRSHAAGYGAAMLSYAFVSMFACALVAWVPTYFVRSFGLSPGEAGMQFGLLMLTCAPLGAIAGGMFCDGLLKRGTSDAPLRVIAICAVAILPASVVLAFAPSALSAQLAIGWNAFFFSAVLAVGPAGVQLITPPQIRGQLAAVTLLVGNLIGLGLGPLSAAIATDYLFADEAAVGASLAAVGGSTCILALACALGWRSAYCDAMSSSSGAETADRSPR